MVGVIQKTVGNLRRPFNKLQVLASAPSLIAGRIKLMSRLTNDIDNVNNTLNTTVLAVFFQ